MATSTITSLPSSGSRILELRHNLQNPSRWTVVLLNGDEHVVSTWQLQDPTQLNKAIGYPVAPARIDRWFRELNELMRPLREGYEAKIWLDNFKKSQRGGQKTQRRG